jgi:hypothetical protein
MPRLRFETARDLLEAFPAAQDELLIEPTDAPSLDFLRTLASDGAMEKAVGFCAYLLPRREAVWWACQSVKLLNPPQEAEEQQALQAAEDWVREPEEERRLGALAIGRQGNYRVAATWLALAAGWAGGSMPPGALAGFEGPNPAALGEEWLPIPPDQTAKAVRTSILIAAWRLEPKDRVALLQTCVDEGARLAEGPAREAT